MERALRFVCEEDSALSFILPNNRATLGRSSECDLLIPDNTISRRHAEFFTADAVFFVRDLGSRNGTFINDQTIQSERIQIGQRVRFGRVPFVVMSIIPSRELDSEIETPPFREVVDEEVEDSVSPAQARVLEMVLQGLSEKQIAAGLHLSQHTVHNHLRALFRAHGVHSRSELICRALSNRRLQTRIF